MFHFRSRLRQVGELVPGQGPRGPRAASERRWWESGGGQHPPVTRELKFNARSAQPPLSAAPRPRRESRENFLRLEKDFFKAEVNKEMSSCATDLEGKKKFNNFPGVAVKYFHFRNWLFFFFFLKS